MRKLCAENNAVIYPRYKQMVNFQVCWKINVNDYSTASHIPLKQKH